MRHVSPAEGVALRCLRHQRGIRALLIEGPPGSGKSSCAEWLAHELSADLVVYQAHAWTDDQELFQGVDIAAAVAGDATSVRQPGALLRAARLSQRGPVVLLIDELDKAPERVEALLLDALQSGRVPVAPGVHERLVANEVIVVITSNGVREHSEALMRRVRRLQLDPLPVEVMVDVAAAESGMPRGIVRLLGVVGRQLAQADGQSLSVQELTRLAADARLAESHDELVELVRQWCTRGPRGRTAQVNLSSAWGEITALRRAQQ